MLQLELIPDLNHCIETVARKEYDNLIKAYLRAGKSDAELEGKIELLRSFLETSDFRRLRQESESYLLQGQKAKFIVYQEDGETRYRLVIA